MGAYMARINFTAQRIENHQCKAGQDQTFIWDAGSPCLGLGATRNGKKSYVFQARLHGKTLRIVMGSPPAWSIPKARARANELQVLVDQGIDPREIAAEVKAKSAAATLREQSLKVLAREAWNFYLKEPHPKWGATHRQDHLNASQVGGEIPKIGKALTKPGPLTSLLALPLNEITADAVAKWLKKEKLTRATSASNSLRKFNAFINWCLTQPAYKTATHADCCTAKIVQDLVPPKKTKEGDSAERGQLKSWFAAVQSIANPAFRVYLQGLMFTGARKIEFQLLKWSDVDFVNPKMTIRDKKTGKRTIPLTPYLSMLIQSLPRINDYVFASPAAKGGYIVGVWKAHSVALKRAGMPHVSVHGLRRTFTSMSEQAEIPAGVSAQVRGHKPSDTIEKNYMRRSIDYLREKQVEFEAWILKEAGIVYEPDSN